MKRDPINPKNKRSQKRKNPHFSQRLLFPSNLSASLFSLFIENLEQIFAAIWDEGDFPIDAQFGDRGASDAAGARESSRGSRDVTRIAAPESRGGPANARSIY